MDFDDADFSLKLHPEWTQEATSENYDTLAIEVESLLADAPNVAVVYPILDSYRRFPIGFTVRFTDGSYGSFLAIDREEIFFSGQGELLTFEEEPEPNEFRVIYRARFSNDELPYETMATAADAYQIFMEDMKGDGSRYIRTEGRYREITEWSEVRDA